MKRTLIILALIAAASTSMTSLCMRRSMEDVTIPHSVQILNHWRVMANRKKQLQKVSAELDEKRKAGKEGSLARQEIRGTEEMAYRLMMDYSHAEQAFEEVCKDGISPETLSSILEFMDSTQSKKEDYEK